MAKNVRSTGSVTIAFGMIAVPTKLYTAVEHGAAVSFNLLHKDCGSRLKQQYVCTKDEQIVPREDMVKGFEFAKDKYAVFTAEELKQLEEAATGAITIDSFVPATAIDPIYYDQPSYMTPDKGGARAFALLVEVMRRTGRIAVGRYAARGKQHIVALRPAPFGGLILQQVRYAEEVRPADDLRIESAAFSTAEVDLGEKLIARYAKEAFDPGQYKDESRERILKAIEAKVAGQAFELPTPAAPKATSDLMDALRASLAS